MLRVFENHKLNLKKGDAIKDHVSKEYKKYLADIRGLHFTAPLNEPGLYELVFNSKLPMAQNFQDWVFKIEENNLHSIAY